MTKIGDFYIFPHMRIVGVITSSTNVKSVKEKIRKSLKKHDLHGLEFWHNADKSLTGDQMSFDVISPYGQKYVTFQLKHWEEALTAEGAPLSLCYGCFCMTKTISGKCGKCSTPKAI